MDPLTEKFLTDFGSQENLDEYLNVNSFENNLDVDNLKYNIYQISHIENENYSFTYKGFKYSIYQSEFCDEDKQEFSNFSFLLSGLYSLNHKLIASTKTKKIAILPFFGHTLFYEKFNLFICKKTPDDWNPIDNYLYKLYYFDIFGRFIKEEKGIVNRIPNIAMINNKIISITFDNNLYGVEEIYDYNLIKVYKFFRVHEIENSYDFYNIELFNLIDNNGVLYSNEYYDNIIVHSSNEKAILQKNLSLNVLDVKSRIIKELPYNYTEDYNDEIIKVAVNKDEYTKYGIIDYNGSEIIKPIFDFIDFNNTENRFKVFNGNYKWEDSNELKKEFEAIKNKIFGFEEDICEVTGKLKEGKWGIINSKLEYVIPPKYDWIEESHQDEYIANIGGSLYEYSLFSFEVGENHDREVLIHSLLAVSGGKWFKISNSSSKIKEIEMINNIILSTKDNIAFIKNSDKKALKL